MYHRNFYDVEYQCRTVNDKMRVDNLIDIDTVLLQRTCVYAYRILSMGSPVHVYGRVLSQNKLIREIYFQKFE